MSEYTPFKLPRSTVPLTFLVVVVVPVKYLPVARVAVDVLPDNVRPRVLLVLQGAGQGQAESDRSTAERIAEEKWPYVRQGYPGVAPSIAGPRYLGPSVLLYGRVKYEMRIWRG